MCKKVKWKGNSSKITGGKIETVVLSSIGDVMILKVTIDALAILIVGNIKLGSSI